MKGRPLEIVVVDDEVQITDLLTIFIQSADHPANIHSFNDSVMAHNFIQSHEVDVVITDYKMPRMNGVELLEGVPPQARKVLISGYISEIAEDKLQKLNAAFFEKPVPMKDLRRFVFESTTD